MMVADDDHWRDWTMTALAIASGYWGGAGFILVPYDKEGKAPDQFAEIVRAYDPDHVVSLTLPLGVWEEWYPGSINLVGVKDPDERKKLLATAHQEQTGWAADLARDQVVSWCSPMRSSRLRGENADRQRETTTRLGRRTPDSDRFHNGFAPSSPASGARLAASESWRSDLGLMAAMRLGVADSDRYERPEPPAEGLDWLIHPMNDAPTSLIWNYEQIPTTISTGLESWFTGGQQLIQVTNSFLQDRGAIVVGDTGSDFALALAYDRIIGNGIWLPPALLADDDAWRRDIQPALSFVRSEFESNGSRLVITSTSVTPEELTEVEKKLREPRFHFEVNGVPQELPERETIRVGPAKVDHGFLEYIINEHVGVPVSIPVVKLPDGSMEALSGLEAPVPSKLVHADRSGWVPYWYVDVALGRDRTPRGRDIPAHALIVDDGPFPTVNLRASQESVTFNPRSMGFVSAGAFLPGRVGRPQLRGLSMLAWVEAMVEPEGLSVRPSSAGRQAETIRRRLGTRDDLLDLITPANVRMLRSFIPLKRKLQPNQRDPQIMVPDFDPYLSFQAMDDLLPGTAAETADLIDRLVAARLLRRGLVLDCEECGRVSFIDADRLGQQYECPQCAATNSLTSPRWNRETDEPRWFYDLYAVFRDLLAANGDVVLLAARALKDKSNTYLDAPELEFVDVATGKAVAEVDVIASVNRELVLVEAKSTGTFTPAKRAAQTQKLLRVARVLRAERIELATTASHWNGEDVKYLTAAGGKVAPFPVSVEVVASLG